VGEAVAGGAGLDDGGLVGEPVDDGGAQAGVMRTGFGSDSLGRMDHASSVLAGLPAARAQDAGGGDP